MDRFVLIQDAPDPNKHNTVAIDGENGFCIQNKLRKQIANITVKKVTTLTSLKSALENRALAYSCFESYFESLDKFDFSENSTLYISINNHSKVTGSARFINAKNGFVEIDEYVDISNIDELSDRNFYEVTRLSVSKTSIGYASKLIICKEILHNAAKNGVKKLLLWTKDEYKKDYEYLNFKYLKNSTEFKHPKLNYKKHTLMYMDIVQAYYEYESSKHELFDFFFFKENEHGYKQSVINILSNKNL